ncbi:MAG: hypothetical protein WCA83_10745 [Azonexus sp.]
MLTVAKHSELQQRAASSDPKPEPAGQRKASATPDSPSGTPIITEPQERKKAGTE